MGNEIESLDTYLLKCKCHTSADNHLIDFVKHASDQLNFVLYLKPVNGFQKYDPCAIEFEFTCKRNFAMKYLRSS